MPSDARMQGGNATARPFKRCVTRRNALLALLAAGGALAGCSRPQDQPEGSHAGMQPDSGSNPFTGSTFAFDTYCTFAVYGDPKAPAKLAQACADFDQLFDLYNDRSDIAAINAAGGERVAVDPRTISLLQHGIEFSSQADGLFDITIGAVSTLWDFNQKIRPNDESIARALEHVDWRCVEIDQGSSTVRLLDPEARLDLGGIAKGYIADQLCSLLAHETNATGAAISLGGNIAFYGNKPDGSPWTVGIRDPNDPGGRTVVGTTSVKGGSLVTSGLYERTFEVDGVRYWHILDPRTGMPVSTDVDAVTVISPSSTAADALSTTLFIAGSHAGAALAQGHDGTAALFIKPDGSTAESPRWQELTNFKA